MIMYQLFAERSLGDDNNDMIKSVCLPANKSLFKFKMYIFIYIIYFDSKTNSFINIKKFYTIKKHFDYK